MKKLHSIFELCIIADVICLFAIAYFLKDNMAAMYTVLILAVIKLISNIIYVSQLFIKKERTKADLIIAIVANVLFIMGFVLILFFKNNLSIYVVVVYCIISFIFSIVSSIITDNQKEKEEEKEKEEKE